MNQPNQLLQPHQSVQTLTSGASCKIEKLLGAGGQGEVYEAKLGTETVALKWYFPHYLQSDPEIRNRLQKAIELGAPDSRFLWPIELVVTDESLGFGYIMPLRDSRYVGIIKLMSGKIDPGFREIITACYQLVDSFLKIHSRGYCYRDISFGNVFFDPKTGDILICDNDNVVENGSDLGGILGTPRFMAPEVVRGEAFPSTKTDQFSLAVLLFYMLTIHHPLEGAKEYQIRCLDAPAMNKLYGTEPIFIFDPQDTSNQPVPGVHDNAIAYWQVYPTFIKDLFTRAFTNGIHKPTERVRESEFKKALVRLRDSIIYCQSCTAENFYDAESMKVSGGQLPACWACSHPINLPPRIRVGKTVIMLNNDTQLYPHHVGGDDYDFSQPVAAVSRNPRDPSIWGLKNLTSERWSITTPDGAVKDVEPGRSLTLAVGTKINFGTAEAEIRL